jgi:hypothetical protein
VAALTNAFCASLADPADVFAPFLIDVLNGLKPIGCRPYVLIGDSHSSLYRRSGVASDQWLAPMHALCIGGSALGLKNPASTSGYGSLIKRFIAQIEAVAPIGSGLPIVFQFGQVDTEFVFNFRRIRGGQRAFDMPAFASFCQESVQAYLSFLTDVFRQDQRGNVSILSILPPSLSDQALIDGYVNGRILSQATSTRKQCGRPFDSWNIPTSRPGRKCTRTTIRCCGRPVRARAFVSWSLSPAFWVPMGWSRRVSFRKHAVAITTSSSSRREPKSNQRCGVSSIIAESSPWLKHRAARRL